MNVLTERTANILLADDDDDDDDDDYDDEDKDMLEVEVERRIPPALKGIGAGAGAGAGAGGRGRRVSTATGAATKASRRRRRSSARFLKLPPHPNGNDDDDDDDDDDPVDHLASTQHLGEVYQNAIRMNAENKINASNSWNLNLIDHMDRFLSTNNSTKSGSSNHSSSRSRTSSSNNNNNNNSMGTTMEDTLGPVTGVNFTKASCTLDASVKIYSYRVDDVHLTSYKVLANLNRTDTNTATSSKKSSQTGDENEGGTASSTANGDARAEGREQRRAARSNAETLETNLANINIHKLDAAFDIDPLFHKMSKTFDEGGAKGLLLANLNVSSKGCNIVFDSTLDENNSLEGEETKVAYGGDENATMVQDHGTTTVVDVSTLTAKLASSLNGQTVQQLPLVPQLATLRTEFADLKQEGFVENVKPSKRYAAPKEDEVEADRSIHVEAMERSRASQAELGRSLMQEHHDDDDSFSSGDDGGAGFATDDFGGGDDDHDDDEDKDVMGDAFPVSFIHDGDHRFSSESFQTTFEASQPPSQATVLLDAIAAGDISGSQSNYEYFNKRALETIQGNNQWAGAAHWKKMQPKRKAKKAGGGADSQESTATASGTKTTKKRKGRAGKSVGKGIIVVDISKPSTVDIKDVLRKPPKGKKGSNNPLQMTKAAISKATKNENLLPLDAGIKVENFTSLFLRPNTNVLDLGGANRTAAAPIRQVGFGGVETWGQQGYNDDNSYGGDDDDGAGFNFGGGDYDDGDDNDPADFVVPELEGVRKVDKIKVGYATIAKKVDVKRLKKDLWDELERTFKERGPTPAWEGNVDKNSNMDAEDDDDDETVDEDMMDEAVQQDDSSTSKSANDDFHNKNKEAAGPLSFKKTVREMQTTQSQGDVTLPFYFICILHLANEKGLALESCGLEDFIIHSS